MKYTDGKIFGQGKKNEKALRKCERLAGDDGLMVWQW